MQIVATKTLPSIEELAEVLKKELSDKYSYELFGAGTRRSILVRKSYFVGAQISIYENAVTIDATPPSVSASLLSIALQLFASLFIIFALLPYRKLEKDIGVFLNKRYN